MNAQMLPAIQIEGNISPKNRGGLVAAFKVDPDFGSGENKEFLRFRQDFRTAFSNAGKGSQNIPLGLLLQYSYFDTEKKSWGAAIDVDRAPWDVLATQCDIYSHYGREEERTITMALRDDMLDGLPERIHYISLGPGESSAFKAKDCRVITGLMATSREIQAATAIDINGRYARDAATTIYDTYHCDAQAIRHDFISDDLPEIEIGAGSTPLVSIFGGTLQNMPHLLDRSRNDGIVRFFTKLRAAMPLAHVLMTVDATPKDIAPSVVTGPYKYSLENELFVLNFMARAKQQGLITDSNYNILRHWRVSEPEWKDNAVNMHIEAKNAHTLSTIDGDYGLVTGDRISVSTSLKGTIEAHAVLLHGAGFGRVKYYPQNAGKATTEQTKFIIHAAP